jgi:hypothetical protein
MRVPSFLQSRMDGNIAGLLDSEVGGIVSFFITSAYLA